MVLPALALALVWWFEPGAPAAAGLLLVAACPIGGISNTYSYLARPSTALSVTLTGLSGILAVAAAFVSACFGAGWVAATVVRATEAGRFTLSAEFATRNIAVATAVAVTMLGRTEFALFGSIYFLTELPLMLTAVAIWRRGRGRAATSFRPGLE